MKTLLGLFVLTLSFSTFAKSSQLLLRARVPATYEVKINAQGMPVIVSNSQNENLPKISISMKENVQLIAIVHP
jgi:hypothetical protein